LIAAVVGRVGRARRTPRQMSTMRTLRRWNVVVGLAHALQAIAILALAQDVTLPVTASFLEGPPGSGDRGGPVTLFALPVGPAVAAFLLLAAVDHLVVAGPAAGWYERNLRREQNPARWWEYAVSASLMVVLIGMLSGISEATALVALFGANAAMILFGLVMERSNRPGAPVDWRPFAYGCVIGAVPWLAIGLQLAVSASEASVPGFVLAIFVTLFALFNSFAVNMWLQYRRVGRWRSYLFGERAYLVLSLVAKSALAWQVFGGALAG
jgi:hypothetical protein